VTTTEQAPGKGARPPGPRNPLAALRFVREPGAFFRDMGRRYGDIFRVRLPFFGENVVLSHPDHLRVYFMSDHTHLEWGDNGFLAPMLGDSSLLVLEGDAHKRHRQLLSPPFHGERMRAYGDLMRELTARVVDAWAVGDVVVMQDVAQSITLEVIARAVFGVDEEGRKGELLRLLSELLSLAGPAVLFGGPLRIDLGPLSPWGRFVRKAAQVDAILFEEIRRRRESGTEGREDILSLVLSARDEEGEPMGDQEIRDEMITLLVAGHETTSTALAFAFYWLHKNPHCLERLHEELGGTSEDTPSEELARLPYLTAVCNETLRIEPILPETVRQVQRPLEVGGYTIPAGTYAMAAIWMTHHREDIFEDPDVFRPERFIDRRYSPYEFIPFGGGVHKCIGYAFALYEMKMVLATVLSRAELEPVSEKVRVVRRNLAVCPSTGVRMRVATRR
jgi:cytochrome P450